MITDFYQQKATRGSNLIEKNCLWIVLGKQLYLSSVTPVGFIVSFINKLISYTKFLYSLWSTKDTIELQTHLTIIDLQHINHLFTRSRGPEYLACFLQSDVSIFRIRYSFLLFVLVLCLLNFSYRIALLLNIVIGTIYPQNIMRFVCEV